MCYNAKQQTNNKIYYKKFNKNRPKNPDYDIQPQYHPPVKPPWKF